MTLCPRIEDLRYYTWLFDCIGRRLPTSLQTDTREVCLFVKDIDSKSRDYEVSVRHVREQLDKSDIKTVSEVGGMKQNKEFFQQSSRFFGDWIAEIRRLCYLNFFFRILSHFYVSSMCLMRRHHLVVRSCVSSLDNSLSDKSFLMLFNHLCFGLPLILFPGTSIAITLLPTYSSSLLNTCPYHFNSSSTYFPALSWIFLPPLLSL